jgi:hypothetical protein
MVGTAGIRAADGGLTFNQKRTVHIPINYHGLALIERDHWIKYYNENLV